MDDQLADAFEALAAVLRGLDRDVSDAVRIDRLNRLEGMIGSLGAVQIRETVAFVNSQREQRRTAGVVASRLDRGLSAQVGLARRISPYQAARYVKAGETLVNDLPETLAELEAGRTSADRALTVAREAGFVRREQRGELDTQIAGQIAGMSDREVQAEAQRLGAALDPEGAAARAAKAERDRNVALRSTEDTMARLTALVPGIQGVAAYAALQQAAEALKAAGDPRTRAQIMTDTMIERITGQATAGDVPIQVNMIVTDQALFNYGDHADEPAILTAHGIAPLVLPAELARRAMLDRTGESKVFLRRLYRDPTTGELAAMDSRARKFPGNQRHFLILRDQYCRTPYCGAPIRHADHVDPAAAGGPTRIINGAGKCEACNHTKQAEGWRETVEPDGSILTTTPTGHRYRSRLPRPPGGPSGKPRAHRPFQITIGQIRPNLELRWYCAAS